MADHVINDNAPDENGIVPWEITEVKIWTEGGDRMVKGAVHPLVPGLAVTSHQFGLFDVTHLASGKLIAKGFARMDNATLTAAEFALCADWHNDADALKTELASTKDEPCGNPEAKCVSLGVERQMNKGELIQMIRSSIPQLDEFPWEGSDSPSHHCYDLLLILAKRAAAKEKAQ